MINLVYPRYSDRLIANMNGWLIGPFGSDGLSSNQQSNFQFSGDMFDDFGVSLHHENSVSHIHADGTLTYDPIRSKITKNPTNVYPEQVRVNYLPGLYLDFKYGRPDQFLSSRDYYSTYNGRNLFITQLSARSYEQYDLNYLRSSNKLYTLSKYVWSWTGQNSTKISFHETRTYYDILGTPIIGDWDWTQALPIKAFLEAWAYVAEHAFAPMRTYEREISWDLRTALYESDFASSPTSIFTAVNLALHKLEKEDDKVYPTEVHYGDLAMEASEKVNATSVNLIAFLRDLRNPLDMIPKLKNLRSLKGLASNMLAVKYGILPTVSDLQKIVGAFRRVAPSLDLEGNRVVYAGRTHMESNGPLTVEVVQRIKLGIAKEDNGFEALEEGLENIGAFPTFKNLWDLVPYSFVLDWFADVGDLLERVDTHLRLIRLNIRYATMSRKVTQELRVSSDLVPHVYGTVKRVQYHRWVSDHAPVPPLSLQSGSGASRHWLEALALLLQRTH